jgi:hypothetical protein
MPKVLVAGEKAFFIHSFSDKELADMEISHTRNHSTIAIGVALDDINMTPDSLASVRPDVMMLLKQSETWKKSDENPGMDGFSLLVFRGKNINAHKSYIATWCGQSKAEMLAKDPGALIGQLVKGFHQLFNAKEYHKKSIIHGLLPK